MLKESYRINKHNLVNYARDKQIRLRILFTLTNEAYNSFQELGFHQICSDMTNLLQYIENHFHEPTNPGYRRQK